MAAVGLPMPGIHDTPPARAPLGLQGFGPDLAAVLGCDRVGVAPPHLQLCRPNELPNQDRLVTRTPEDSTIVDCSYRVACRQIPCTKKAKTPHIVDVVVGRVPTPRGSFRLIVGQYQSAVASVAFF